MYSKARRRRAVASNVRPARVPPRRAAVVLRHVAFEDLGLLAPVLDEAGWDASYCDAPIAALSDPSIAAADLLIVLGGPIGVYDLEAFPFLAREISLLEDRLANDRAADPHRLRQFPLPGQLVPRTDRFGEDQVLNLIGDLLREPISLQ